MAGNNKSTVSGLQEYCARNSIPLPTYVYLDSSDPSDGFVCKVEVNDVEAMGNGRSKRDAKHLCAANMMRKLQKLSIGDNDNSAINLADELRNSNRDMVKELRDYCVQHEHPLPTIEIIQQTGTPDAPEFTALCTIASIKRCGVSDKKKDAKQKAAAEMLENIRVVSTARNEIKGLATGLDDQIEDIEGERRQLFKTYYELTEAGKEENHGTLLCDRHYYFTKFFPSLKAAAFKVLESTEYESEKDQVLDLFAALKLNAKTTQMQAESKMEPLLVIDLDTEIDCVFSGFESEIYTKILNYFKEMLI